MNCVNKIILKISSPLEHYLLSCSGGNDMETDDMENQVIQEGSLRRQKLSRTVCKAIIEASA